MLCVKYVASDVEYVRFIGRQVFQKSMTTSFLFDEL